MEFLFLLLGLISGGFISTVIMAFLKMGKTN